MSAPLTPAEGLAAHIIGSLEPVTFDSMGTALYSWQIAHETQTEDRAAAVQRIMAKRVDEEDV